MTSNHLRMPLAEWIYRMRVAGVAREAVGIAFTAALFDISSNAELAEMSGHAAGSRTLDKHKGDLVKGGWVLIPPCRGGRGHGVRVVPAVAETPVEFTDVSARDPDKIAGAVAKQTPAFSATHRNSERGAKLAPQSHNETPAANDPNRTTSGAKFADVSPRAPAYKESLRDTYTVDSEVKSPLYPPNDGQGVTFENGRLELHNGTRAYWLDRFGGDEIRLTDALLQAAAYVQPNSQTRSLDVQVSSQLSRKCAEKRDRDERYEKAAKANTAAKSNSNSSKRLPLGDLADAVGSVFENQPPEEKSVTKRLTHER